jgi:hypothetical protein
VKVRLTGQGTRPLLMHNVRLASPLNPYAKQLKALNAKRVKTDEDRLEIARVEWEGGLYWMDGIGPYIPGPNLLASLIGGARLLKAGKKVERGVTVDGIEFPLIYRGPRDIDALWGGGESEYVDVRTVKVQTSKVDRCRPIFREWAFEAELLLDPKVIEPEEFRAVADNAGQFEGLGDYRRMFGRFNATVEAL